MIDRITRKNNIKKQVHQLKAIYKTNDLRGQKIVENWLPEKVSIKSGKILNDIRN